MAITVSAASNQAAIDHAMDEMAFSRSATTQISAAANGIWEGLQMIRAGGKRVVDGCLLLRQTVKDMDERREGLRMANIRRSRLS